MLFAVSDPSRDSLRSHHGGQVSLYVDLDYPLELGKYFTLDSPLSDLSQGLYTKAQISNYSPTCIKEV
jgi:hypothetical protein